MRVQREDLAEGQVWVAGGVHGDRTREVIAITNPESRDWAKATVKSQTGKTEEVLRVSLLNWINSNGATLRQEEGHG